MVLHASPSFRLAGFGGSPSGAPVEMSSAWGSFAGDEKSSL
jgi:hypothetical protein